MTKNYRNNLIISLAIASIVFYFLIWPTYNFFKYSYDGVFDDIEEYEFLFKDPIMLDTFFSGNGQVRKTDSHFVYLTKDKKVFEIIEFNDLNSMDIKQITFSTRTNFPNYENWDGRLLNSDINGVPQIAIKNHLPFEEHLYVDFNRNAPLQIIRDEPNCKVYYGSLLKMMLSGAERKPLVFYDFKTVSKTIIAFYKTKYRLLLIIVTSDKNSIEEEDLELLKFEYE